MAQRRARDAGKGVALMVAASLATWGVQQVATGAPIAGGVGVGVALLLFVGYQWAESNDHDKTYDDVIEALGGEQTFRELSTMTADEIRRLREQARNGG